jgi:hypothetical protein
MAGFKCIAAKGYQEILSPIITERAGFMTENTRLISGDVEKEPLRTEQGTPVDVDICEDEPQVIAWSEYHETLSTRDYEAFQFPHVMLSCDFKAVWRKLESYSCFNFRLTLDKLLKEATRRWCMPDAPDTIEKFQEYVKCQVLTSLHQSTVYIRTIEDGSRVEIALSKLDVMLAAIVSSAVISIRRH